MLICRQQTRNLLVRANSGQLRYIVAELDLPDREMPWGATDAECQTKIWNLQQQRGGTALAELELLLREQQAVRPELRYSLYISRGERETNDPWCEVLLRDLQARPLLPD